MDEDYRQPVDLFHDRLTNFALLRITDNLSYFYLRTHHVLIDGYGANNLIRHVAAVYSGAVPETGEVNFSTSCGPGAQKAFNHAVWTLHSFWYPEAVKAFTAVTEAEPGCAMGYWGIAMSHWYPLWYPPGPAALAT